MIKRTEEQLLDIMQGFEQTAYFSGLREIIQRKQEVIKGKLTEVDPQDALAVQKLQIEYKTLGRLLTLYSELKKETGGVTNEY